MRKPTEYRKALFWCMGLVTASYLAFSLVVYKYCGRYVASPSLGSAGPVIEKVAYGIGLLGLLASGMIYAHVGAKYLFVRLLRNSRHLQEKTPQHWIIWFSCSIGLCLLSFVLASAVCTSHIIPRISADDTDTHLQLSGRSRRFHLFLPSRSHASRHPTLLRPLERHQDRHRLGQSRMVSQHGLIGRRRLPLRFRDIRCRPPHQRGI